MFAIDNYVKIGWNRQVFIFFSSQDPTALARIRQETETAVREFVPISVWKPVPELGFPPVGMSARGSC